MGKVLMLFSGYKSVAAGLGLIGLGLWYLSQGEFDAAVAKMSEGLAVIGLRGALGSASAPLPVTQTPPGPDSPKPAK